MGPESHPLPLSSSQQGIWLKEQLEPGSTQFSEPQAFLLKGELNVEALGEALQAMVDHQECLRTRFGEKDGNPFRLVLPTVLVSLDMEDIGHLPDDQRARAMDEIIREDDQGPFDLAQGPPWRVRLVRLEPRLHYLLWNCHHLVTDGWSRNIFNQQLSELYGKRLAGLPLALKKAGGDYSRYVRELEESATGRLASKSLLFWEKKLQDCPSPSGLPKDPPGPDGGSRRCAMASRVLSQQVMAGIRTLAGKSSTTPFVVLLASFKLLVARLSGSDDVLLGCPVADRGREWTKDLIGLFLETLPLRTDISGNPSFKELVERVKSTVNDSLEHQLSMDRLVAEFRPSGDSGGAPLFNILFNMHSVMEPEPLKLQGLEVEEVDRYPAHAKCDLTLYVGRKGEGIRLVSVFEEARYRQSTMELYLEQLCWITEQVVASPDLPARRYSLIPPPRRNSFPDPALPIATEKFAPIIQQVLKAAHAASDQTAIRQDGRDWSYRELVSRSARIAEDLTRMGVQGGDTVIISGPRSFALVASILGVMMRNAVFFLLDPSLPPERQRILCEESGASFQVNVAPSPGSSHPKALRQGDLPVLGITSDDFDGELVGPFSLPDFEPTDAAYIFFTSGTTGRPKGVIGNQRGLSHFINWERELLSVDPDDRVAQLTTLSFDVILRDLFLPLTSGATLCLPGDDVLQEADRIMEWLSVEGITILHTVPSLASFWLSSSNAPQGGIVLRATLFAGEPLPAKLVRNWRRLPGKKGHIFNLYGPTETTLAKACFKVGGNPSPGTQPIGSAIPGSQLLILNPSDQLCGPREPGEIVIRTPYRSNGYLIGDPRDKRFFPNPFREDPTDILYRTGDLGAYDTDGTLLIFGRIDDQVKIRGIRIEPSEVARALELHPGIAQCVVVAIDDEGAGKRLAAYFKPAGQESAIDTQSLRGHLRDRLPEYMVPDSYTPLESIPLTKNGKVDRSRLPAPVKNVAGDPAQAKPASPLEVHVARMWSDVLSVSDFSVHDNFFDLGGHSLLATKLVARLNKQFGRSISLWAFSRNPTISGMAAVLSGSSGGEPRPTQGNDSVPEESFPLSPTQEAIWVNTRQLGSSPHLNMVRAFRVSAAVDASLLREALGITVGRHDILRANFVETARGPRMRIAAKMEPVFEESVHTGEKAPVAANLARLQSRTFSLSSEPLVRFHLLRSGKESGIFVIVSHYIILDEESADLLAREIHQTYAALCRGEPVGIDRAGLQFTDSVGEKQIKPDNWEEAERFWRERLNGAAQLELPTESRRERRLPVSSNRAVAEVHSSLLEKVDAFIREGGISEKAVLLGALNVLIFRYTGTDDISSGELLPMRPPGNESLPGPCYNTIVHRVILDGELTFSQLVQRVENDFKETAKHGAYPFGKLLELLNPPRTAGRHPLFQVMVLHDQRSGIGSPEGMLFTPVDSPPQASEFDLEVRVHRTGESCRVQLNGRSDLFDQQTMEHLAALYTSLLENLLVTTDQPVRTIAMTGTEEGARILSRWFGAGNDALPQACIHELFMAQAKKNPDVIALACGSESLTYRELADRAGQMARNLMKNGAGPGSHVGVYLARSMDFVVGILGILQSGSAYVPLARDYPALRVQQIVRDAGISLIVTDQVPPGIDPGMPVTLVHPATSVEAPLKTNLPGVSPADPAYVMYTSGSTGEPKGSVIPHRGVVRLVRDQSYADFSIPGKFLFLASPAFDASTFEIWGPLLNGSTCVIHPGASLNLDELKDTISRHQVGTLWLTAGLFNLVIDTDPGILRPVTHVLTGGEALSVSHIARAMEVLPGLRLTNGYGPTECTTFACTHSINPSDTRGYSIPIGRPIGDTTACILDEGGNPLPHGFTGELHLGGPGLALGYLNDPTLTGDRFFTRSLPGLNDQRLYRTGDLCRYREDGCIEFIGRKDGQLKIRGYRVETGEIENALKQNPLILQTVVVGRKLQGTTTDLVAYIVPADPDNPPSSSELVSYLSSRVPGYCIPAHFVSLPAIPLTRNGKVNKRSLPDPRQESAQPDSTGPDSPMERDLLAIWRKLFRDRPIHCRDNFFDLGGHSLLAIQMASEVEKLTGRKFKASSLFEAPTIRDLARVLSREESPATFESLIPLQSEGDRCPLFCLPGMKGDTYGFILLAGHLAPSRPVYGLQAIGWDGTRNQQGTVEEMARHYGREIETFYPDGPFNLMGYSAGGWVAYAVAQYLRERGRDVRLYIYDTSIIPTTIPLLPFVFNQLIKIIDWAPHHLVTLKRLPARDRWTYLRLRLGSLGEFFSREETVQKTRRKDLLSDQAAEEMDYFTRVIVAYQPGKYRGDVVYLSARGRDRRRYNLLLWKYFIKGKFTVHYFDGGHEGLIDPRHVGEVASRLEEILSGSDPGK